MEVFDISRPLGLHTPVYPGDPPVQLTRLHDLKRGAPYPLTAVALSVHAATTHVDALAHFLADGIGAEGLPWEALLGPAIVVDVRTAPADLDAAAVAALAPPPASQRVLFKTQAEGRPRSGDTWSPTLLPEAAAWLVAQGIRLVGIDTLSGAPAADPAPTHRVLLAAGVVILEGLDLSCATPGRYLLLFLPLLLPGADGALAPAILVRDLPQ
ncbi:MAG: cyclase family protein [Chloroflexi bacterium]|nr:cyclase family protein [Chloroflexota bacterium]